MEPSDINSVRSVRLTEGIPEAFVGNPSGRDSAAVSQGAVWEITYHGSWNREGRAERALLAVVQTACVEEVSPPKVDDQAQGWTGAAAIGVRETGKREVVAVDIGASEDGAFWKAFLRGLASRGLKGMELVISDAHMGAGALSQGLPVELWPWRLAAAHWRSRVALPARTLLPEALPQSVDW